MDELIRKAKGVIEKKYMAPYHTVSAVLITKDGREYAGINIDHFSGYLCAETSALAAAINDGVMEFDQIVAVGKTKDDQFDVVNPCGKCRQLLHDFAPGISVIVHDGNVVKTVPIDELLPYGFKRRQNKIRRARLGESVE